MARARRRKPAKKSPVRRPKRPRKEVKPLPFDRRKRPHKRAPRPDLRRAKERAALQRWLNQHPTVAASLRWESPTGLRDYNAWTAAEQSDLFTYYWHIRERNQLGLADPPPNALSPADNAFPATALRIEHAWPLYVAHAANSLYVEVRNRVPWRVADAAPEILTRLFDSRAMFRRTDAGLYQLGDVNQLFGRGGWILPAPPDVVRAFLEGNALIGADRIDTIGRLLAWCRQNLTHFTGAAETANFERHWQYRGLPPVSRILARTVQTGSTYTDPRHWTAGCHGTNGFLAAVLRFVNIPVDYLRPQNVGHATPKFVTDSRYLSHGDDPYNAYSRTASYPATELLIDEAKYSEWFDPTTTTAAERDNNIARRVYELALVHLPNYLLQTYCSDVAAGRGHAESDVARAFSRWYTVAELEAMQLWERLQAKVAALGGCSYLP